MKNWIHYPLAAVVAALIGFGSALFSASERASRAGSMGDAEGGLRAAVEELRLKQERLALQLEELPAAPSGAPVAGRTPVLNLDEAIAAYMAKQLEPEEGDGQGDELILDAESQAIADSIVSGQVTGNELNALWQKLREEGRIDDVVAAIERQVELTPNNPDLQNELGKAYIQKLFDVGMGPMAAAWGEKADVAFDRALDLDEDHWEARFQKAMALSNWPTFLGKQAEAKRQFEVLLERQERGVPEDSHAMTYFFLGNLYDQGGDHEKALGIWSRGATRFPGNNSLRQKLENR